MKATTEFEVGDEVIIREDLIGGNTYGTIYFNPAMEAYRGRKAVILSKRPGSIITNSFHYSINLEEGLWGWSATMFKPKKKQFNSLEAICLNL